MKLLPSEEAAEAADAFEDMLRRLVPGPVGARELENDHVVVEKSVVDGGWHQLGASGAAGGAGMDLIDLAAMADVWGHAFIAAPFVPALLLYRWGLDTEQPGEALPTVALPAAPTAPAVAPYGADHPVVMILGDSAGRSEVGALDSTGYESLSDLAGWARSMPIAFAQRPTSGLSRTALADVFTLGCAELAGIAAAALETAAGYATTRVQFDQPIAEFQAVRHHLADMARDIEVARTGVLCMANDPDRAEDIATVITRSLLRTLSKSIQLHGGFGFTWEAGLHHYLRHAMVWSLIFDGCRNAMVAASS